MAKGHEASAGASAQAKVNGLEKWLDGVYAKAPALPTGARDWIANNAWWITLIGGLLGLWGTYSLWQVAQWGDGWIQYANQASDYYGAAPAAATGFSATIWVVVIVAAVQAVLSLLAVSGLKAHRKGGWNLLFYSALLSVATAVLYLFTSNYGFGNFLGSLIGCAIGLYFLFQIRSHFLPKKS